MSLCSLPNAAQDFSQLEEKATVFDACRASRSKILAVARAGDGQFGGCYPNAKREDVAAQRRTPCEIMDSIKQRQDEYQVSEIFPGKLFKYADPPAVTNTSCLPARNDRQSDPNQHYRQQIQVKWALTSPVTAREDATEDGYYHQGVRNSIELGAQARLSQR